MGGGERGFTLVELMVVVGIVAALAAVAILSFNSYVRHARINQAYTMLGEIRLREEQYKAEFGAYVTTQRWPVALPTPGGVVWGAPPPATNWVALGAVPDGVTHFQFEVTAGNPGDDPGAAWGGPIPNEHWFIANAYGDLDADGRPSQFETYSADRRVWVNPGGGGFEYEGQ